MTQPSSRATVVFSCLGHLLIHLCTAFYFVIVLALEQDWNLPYHELISLWTLGALMVGAAALPAGMLSDRFGAPPMMVVFFIGMGACSIGAGVSEGKVDLLLWLTGIGLFAAIYHPVGIPWLVRNAGDAKGKALGFNGIFGSLGAASAGITAGLLIDVFSWRVAFALPGIISVVIGIALWLFVLRGRIADAPAEAAARKASGREMARVFGILLITMFMAGMIFNSTQTALPKAFAVRVDGLLGEGALGVGLLVALVYGAAGIMQVAGGHMADRFPAKYVYVAAISLQVPLLYIAAGAGGFALVVVATLMVVANVGALPAENMLLARYAPPRRHGLVFGLKFVLAFGAGPLAVQLVSLVQGRTGEFYWLFVALSLFAACALAAAVLLPSDRVEVAVSKAGA